MSIACSTSINKNSFEGALRSASELGFDSVDVLCIDG